MPWPKGKKMPTEMVEKRSATLVANGKRRKQPVCLDGVTYWKCGACRIYKPEADYYIDGKTAAGVAAQCKACHAECSIRTRDSNRARTANAEYMRRARAADPEKFRERERVAAAKRRNVSPEKIAARAALNNAVKRGDLAKPAACEDCGETKKLTGHHDDYSKPLDVRWLCYVCHGRQHRAVEFRHVEAKLLETA